LGSLKKASEKPDDAIPVKAHKRSKYGNVKKVGLDGFTYDSTAECAFADLLSGGGIPYERQVSFHVGGLDVKKSNTFLLRDGGCRAVHYIADFVVVVNNLTFIIDVKGHRTKEFMIKRNLLMAKLVSENKYSTHCFKEVKKDGIQSLYNLLSLLHDGRHTLDI